MFCVSPIDDCEFLRQRGDGSFFCDKLNEPVGLAQRHEKCTYIPNYDYCKIIEYVPIVCVDVVTSIEFSDDLFLFKRKNPPLKNEYWFIGGRLNKFEKPLDCVIRKLREDIGVTSFNIVRELGTFSTVFCDSIFEGIKTHTINITYHAVLKNDTKFILSSEYTDYKKMIRYQVPSTYDNYLSKVLSAINW
jgi:ADP-ribose pyrophosphatase YjhB (NUDIX family)